MKKLFYILVFFISSFLSNNLLGNDKIYETYSNMFFIYSDEYVRVDENNLNNIKDDKYRKNLEQTVIQGMSSFEKFEMYVDKSSYNLSLDSYENERVPFFSVRTTIYEPEAVEKIKGQFEYEIISRDNYKVYSAFSPEDEFGNHYYFVVVDIGQNTLVELVFYEPLISYEEFKIKVRNVIESISFYKDKYIGNDFYLAKEFSDHSRYALEETYEKCFQQLLPQNKNENIDKIVFFPKKILPDTIQKECLVEVFAFIFYSKIEPQLSTDIKKKLSSGDLSKIETSEIEELCQTDFIDLFNSVADLYEMDLQRCNIMNNSYKKPMLFSIFSNETATVYPILIFDESRDFDTAITVIITRNKEIDTLTADEFKAFSQSVMFKIFKL